MFFIKETALTTAFFGFKLIRSNVYMQICILMYRFQKITQLDQCGSEHSARTKQEQELINERLSTSNTILIAILCEIAQVNRTYDYRRIIMTVNHRTIPIWTNAFNKKRIYRFIWFLEISSVIHQKRKCYKKSFPQH